MDFTADERDLLLAGLFELCVARFEDAGLVDHVTALAIRLGGDPDQVFFRARTAGTGSADRAFCTDADVREDRR
jgi:hypothetical protein